MRLFLSKTTRLPSRFIRTSREMAMAMRHRRVGAPAWRLVLLLVLFALSAGAASAGQAWLRWPGNPVFGPSKSGWDSRFVADPAVIKDGLGYTMYYNAWGATQAAIGRATSLDGIFWTHAEEPVLRGDYSAWDWTGVYMPAVLKDGDVYRLWYWAGNPDFSIGYATSSDGIIFQKHPEAVLHNTPGGWDNYIQLPWVIRDADGYKLYYIGSGPYEGDGTYLGVATSNDALTWSKHPANPLFPMPAGWNGYGPSVVLHEGVYHLWYSDGVSIFHATSPDGLAWTKDGDQPVLGPLPPREPYRVAGPSVLHDGSGWRMWYSSSVYDDAISFAGTGPLPDVKRVFLPFAVK